MQIEVMAKDEEGNVLIEGKLNRKEVAFLLQYSINDLMAAGVMFNLEQPDHDESRFTFPKRELND